MSFISCWICYRTLFFALASGHCFWFPSLGDALRVNHFLFNGFALKMFRYLLLSRGCYSFDRWLWVWRRKEVIGISVVTSLFVNLLIHKCKRSVVNHFLSHTDDACKVKLCANYPITVVRWRFLLVYWNHSSNDSDSDDDIVEYSSLGVPVTMICCWGWSSS